jgi:glycosyltransferase involved in cell wall biosynthesis
MPESILVLSYRDMGHPEMGGAEIIMYEVYRRLRAAGHGVTFLTCRFPGSARAESLDGMEILRTGNLYNFNFAVGSYYRRHLRDRRFTVVVEDLNKIPFYSPLFQREVPVLVNVPHLFGTTVFSQAPWPLALYVYLQEQTIPKVYGECDFQVLSDSTRDDLHARGIPGERLHVIRSGIDHGYYVPPAGGRPVPPGPVLLYLGRLKRYKCIEHPIRVLPRLRRRIPEVSYWIVGEGDYREELERIAREEGVEENVRFFGFRQGAEKLELLHKSRVLVYTSPKEGWGLSVIEANATGLPAVASDSPGLRESVRHEITGFLVPHGDLEALHDRLLSLLSDDVLWRTMSEAGLQWASRFNWDRMAEETLELITQSVRRGRGRAAALPTGAFPRGWAPGRGAAPRSGPPREGEGR